MQRDMDLIRRIALATTSLESGEALEELDGVDPASFAMHVIWMEEAGLVRAITQEPLGADDEPYGVVLRLTWAGCEFADAVRSDTLWKKARDKVLMPSGSWTFGVLLDWLKAEIREGLPTLRGGI